MIVKLLLKLYTRKNREIAKISEEEEQKLYLFRNPEDVVRLMKANSTAQVMRYFEGNTDEERAVAKGAAMILKIMREAHYNAVATYDKKNDKQSHGLWRTFKTKNRTN